MSRDGEAAAPKGIGKGHHDLGEYPDALECYTAGLAIVREVGGRNGEADALVGLGEVYRQREEYGHAHDSLEVALVIYREMKIHELLSREYSKLGERAIALEHLRNHIRLREVILGEESRRTVHALQSARQIEGAQKEAEIERLLNVELKEAFDRLEPARSAACLRGSSIHLIKLDVVPARESGRVLDDRGPLGIRDSSTRVKVIHSPCG
jgi:tetratricopeptide (TPR) repeat protein